jgi:hypothetical protein
MSENSVSFAKAVGQANQAQTNITLTYDARY